MCVCVCVCVAAEITLLAALLSQSSAYCSKQDVYVVAKCWSFVILNLPIFLWVYTFTVLTMFLLGAC